MTLPVVFTAGSAGYNLTNSLRFRSSASAYLNRTPASAGNRKTWTWSGWVKRSNISSNGVLFAARTGSDATYFNLSFQSAGDLRIESNSETAYPLYKTNALFRDPSAWYHIVMTLDMTQATSTDRVKVYVNNVLQTTASYNVPAQNTDLNVNNTVTHLIGQQASGNYFDGYLTEVNFIDGQALTPSSFGQTDPATGVWQPKKYSGTYGTNGFYLNFTDNSNNTATTIGKDYSGNGNNWTPNNISVTNGATYDSMTDVPTLTNPTTANYCVLNPLNKNASVTVTNGNLDISTSATNVGIFATLGISTGKWYFEVTFTNSSGVPAIGVVQSNWDRSFVGYGIAGGGGGIGYHSNGIIYNNGTQVQTGLATYTSGDIIGVALNLDSGSVTFYKNNVQVGSTVTGLTGEWFPAVSGQVSTTLTANFGQRPFAYTPPTGFVALNTFNLPTPTIGATASTQANKYFDIALYTGNSGSQSITSLGFQPDLVWLKSRSNSATNHLLEDVIRGTKNSLLSNDTSAELARGINAFLSNGFSFNDFAGGDGNSSGQTYVAWNWKANGSGSTNTAGSITSTVSANTSAGFSIVTYTGNSSTATVGHGLGVAPKMVIVKSRSQADNWQVWHTGLTGTTYYLQLNSTGAQTTTSTPWSGSFTSTTIGLTSISNASGQTYVAYCFAQIAGYSAFGSYTGNGSSDGPFVFTGFRPKYLMVKRTDASASWTAMDTARNTSNATTAILYPNLSDAEATSGTGWLLLSNGFKSISTGTDWNANGGTYIYMAFAEVPTKFSLAR
jgi:hypothetical protein